MTDLNTVCLVGRLAQDAAVETKPSGLVICKFTLVVNRNKKKKDSDEWESKPSFINMTIFGNFAEKISEKLKKGVTVAVNGHLEEDVWLDGNTKKSKLTVKPDSLNVISYKKAADTDVGMVEDGESYNVSSPDDSFYEVDGYGN